MTSRHLVSANWSGERRSVGSGSRRSLCTTASISSTASAGNGTIQSDGERVSRVHARSDILAGDTGEVPCVPLGGGRPLRVDVDGVQRLAGRHEQAIALGAAEAEI